MFFSWGRFNLDFSHKTLIMGILNVTPDSFSDGGRYFNKDMAVEHALEMVRDGADIIDVGGISTRPGAIEISEEEEIRRTVPVIQAIAERIPVPVSIDTYRAGVARAAIEAGASIVNDISGLRFDSLMPQVVAEFHLPVVVMHIKGTPKDMQAAPAYADLMGEIIAYLTESIAIAERAGIKDIIIDPGIGFGKTIDHNLEIIKQLDRLSHLGRPILVGPSRKAFIGKILGDVPVDQRLEGTAAAVAASVLNGAHIVRVHDVRQMSRVVKVVDAIKRGGARALFPIV